LSREEPGEVMPGSSLLNDPLRASQLKGIA
jgi:hypothetical protein